MRFLTNNLKKANRQTLCNIFGYKHYLCWFENDGNADDANSYKSLWMYDTITECVRKKTAMYLSTIFTTFLLLVKPFSLQKRFKKILL